jgi:trimeric autotransporter adhesin
MALLQPGCEGFFVDPVLTSLSIGPAATIQTGLTVQMNAVGTYNDGSQKNLKASSVFWSSGTPSIATISTTGLVTGLSSGQAMITGASGTVTGTVTITVTIGGLTSIKVTTADGLTSIPYGSTEQFVATGTANGQPVDITHSVHWSTNPQNINDVSIDPNSGLLTTTSGATATAQFTVVAIDPTTGISGQINFTVHP